MKPFRILYLFALLLVLSSTQAGCSMFRAEKTQGVVSSSQPHQAMVRQYQITGFRYDIPEADKTSLLPFGFSMQSFVEGLFSSEEQGSLAAGRKVEELALLRTPEPRLPAPALRAPLQSRFCEKIDRRLSSVEFEDCMAISLNSTGHHSTRGQPILQGHFEQLNGVKPTGRVLLIGGVHGDELSSVSIVFEWIQFLKNHHDGSFVWNVVPVMNPDGLFGKKPSRTNANGVDLNRNMPTADWQSSALAYWQNQAEGSPRKFPGNRPASEAETQWLIAEIDHFKPDMIITVHAPHNLIDYDAPNRENAPRQFGHLRGNQLGTYPGSLGNYAGVKRGIPVVTIELPSANTATSVAQAQLMWTDMLDWLEKTIPLENQRFLKNREYARVRQS